MVAPTTATETAIASDSTTPATANANVFAVRKRNRFGAANNALVMVR